MTPGNLRQTLHRAATSSRGSSSTRSASGLREPTRDEVEEELGELKLLEFCKPTLKHVNFDDEKN